RCQYCGARADSIDHVVPRSRGGLHAWDNVVAACRPCNVRKRDRLLVDSGMRLRCVPTAPHGIGWSLRAAGGVPDEWGTYLAPFEPAELSGAAEAFGAAVPAVAG